MRKFNIIEEFNKEILNDFGEDVKNKIPLKRKQFYQYIFIRGFSLAIQHIDDIIKIEDKLERLKKYKKLVDDMRGSLEDEINKALSGINKKKNDKSQE